MILTQKETTMTKRLKTLQKAIDEGNYNCPVEKIAEKLLKKNPKLSDKIHKEVKSGKRNKRPDK